MEGVNKGSEGFCTWICAARKRTNPERFYLCSLSSFILSSFPLFLLRLYRPFLSARTFSFSIVSIGFSLDVDPWINKAGTDHSTGKYRERTKLSSSLFGILTKAHGLLLSLFPLLFARSFSRLLFFFILPVLSIRPAHAIVFSANSRAFKISSDFRRIAAPNQPNFPGLPSLCIDTVALESAILYLRIVGHSLLPFFITVSDDVNLGGIFDIFYRRSFSKNSLEIVC